MEEQEEKGISLLQLMKVMFSRWLTLIISVVLVFIIGIIFIQFGYNKNAEVYVSQFNYRIVGLSSGKYIDGSTFDYRSLTKIETLSKVKNSNDEFKSIDIEEMIENSDLSLSVVTKENEDEGRTDTYYELRVAKKYFDSANQAKSFIDTLVSTPLDKTLELLDVLVHDTQLKAYENANNYTTMLNSLESQYNTIISGYNSIISDYGNLVYTESVKPNNKVISDYRMEVQIYFTDNTFSELYNDLKYSGYVKDYDSQINSLKLSLKNMEEELEVNTAKLTELKAQRDSLIEKATATNSLQNLDLTEYNNRIITLTERNKDLEKEIEILNIKITNGETADATSFESKMDTYYQELQKMTTDYNQIYTYVITENADVYYNKTGVIEEDGGMSLIVAAIILVVVGVIAGACVNLVIDHKKLSSDYVVEPKNKEIDKKEE